MPDYLELTTNPLFESLKPQADDQRKYLVLIGYVAGIVNEIVTVYESLDLCTYLEIPRAAIVWAEKAIPSQECSPTKLVIEATAKVNRVTTAARKIEAGFLSGLIASTFLTKAARGVTIDIQIDGQTAVAGPGCPGRFAHQTHAEPLGTSHCFLSGFCVSDPVH